MHGNKYIRMKSRSVLIVFVRSIESHNGKVDMSVRRDHVAVEGFGNVTNVRGALTLCRTKFFFFAFVVVSAQLSLDVVRCVKLRCLKRFEM